MDLSNIRFCWMVYRSNICRCKQRQICKSRLFERSNLSDLRIWYFGSGQTFGWDSVQNSNFRERLRAQEISFVLAGGLTADNVSEGIRIFEPDIVDVSSGVENETGKDEEKIRGFVEQVKNI